MLQLPLTENSTSTLIGELSACQVDRERERERENRTVTTGSPPAGSQVPLVCLAAKVEEEPDKEEEEVVARDEVREKRRVACISLGAGSEAGEDERGGRGDMMRETGSGG